jgi:septum formation protein
MVAAAAGKLILASTSPRRIELLRLMGLDFEVMPAGVEERHMAGEGPGEHVLRLSRQKAHAVSCRYPDAWVMGADTIVVINGEMLGKPAAVSEAKEMLKKLSGREHCVYTGFTVMRQAGEVLSGDVAISSVLFKDISEEEINWYVRTEEPYDKAGGYALQGIGAFFIREIRGSYTNIIGLPLCEAVSMLKSLGAIEFPGIDNG